jgi:hypothetical protein
MGIRFVNLTTAQQEKVAEFSEEAMKKAIEDPPKEPADEP